jgi:hypothetical protein
MIVFTISAFSFVDRHFACEIIMRFKTDWISSFISTNLVDVFISLTIETLLDSAIINEQFTNYLRVLVKQIVFDQTIRLLDVVDLDNKWW